MTKHSTLMENIDLLISRGIDTSKLTVGDMRTITNLLSFECTKIENIKKKIKANRHNLAKITTKELTTLMIYYYNIKKKKYYESVKTMLEYKQREERSDNNQLTR